jgi:hypothetical protein
MIRRETNVFCNRDAGDGNDGGPKFGEYPFDAKRGEYGRGRPTTAVVAAADDEVSAGVAALFGAFGQEYQAVSAHTQAFHEQFVNLLNAGAGAYVSTEVANAEQALQNAVSAPARTLLGESSTGTGAAAATGVAATSAATGVTCSGGATFSPYESLISNTAANLQRLGHTWTNVTAPGLLGAGLPNLPQISDSAGSQ